MKNATPEKRLPGRPRTWGQLVSFRLPRAIAVRLERRLLLLQAKSGMKNRTKFILESLEKNLDAYDQADKQRPREKPKSQREKSWRDLKELLE